MTQEQLQQKAEALYPIELRTSSLHVPHDIYECERNAYIQGYQDGQDAYREAAEAMYKALKDLMNGVSQLPPLAAIAGVLVKEYEVAKQAIDNYEKLNK